MVYKVSTSEVATFLTCKQRWMYAHHPSYHLEPRTLGIALTRGVIGHKALEVYYDGIASGESHEDSVTRASDYLMKKAIQEMHTGDSEKAKMIADLQVILQNYFKEMQWLIRTYNIVGVEHLVTAKLPGSEVFFAGRIDLALGVKSGPYKDEVIPWDHKFCYNFWPEKALLMNPQLPNYVWALREMGQYARRGNMNMVRYRSDAIEKLRQEEVFTNSTKRDTFILNHTQTAETIVELKEQKTVSIKDGITRSASKFNCEYCPFIVLCDTEANGEDSATMIKANFRPNSYGYDSELDIS
jgi:hypothetical protein